MTDETSPAAPPTLQVGEDMAFQRRDWVAERIGWAAMALVVAAALLGAFGVGPLSWTTKIDASGVMQVEYDWIQRQTAPATIKLEVDLAAAAGGGIELEVDQGFLEAFSIHSMRPEPAESVATSQGLRLRFGAEPGGGRARLYIEVSPKVIGLRRTRLGLAGHEPVELAVFVHP
jgi:hypothetical protein